MRAIAAVLLVPMPYLFAQQGLTLADVVREAAQYPSVRAGAERVNAAAAAIRLARTSYLPQINAIGQVNRATRNNIFGMVLPNPVLPAISGPPLLSNSLTSVWGSAVGVGVSWEPFDFGLRKATVDRALAARERAEAAARVTAFEVGTQAADAFLTALAAEQTVRTAQAAVDRAKAISDVVSAQVRADIRPGADASRARAELAAAESALAQAEGAVAEARAALALYTDRSAGALDPGVFLSGEKELAATAAGHPRIIEQQRAVAESQAALAVLNRSWFPRFNLQGVSYARGSGAMPDGSTLGGLNGLGPNIHNWGAGLTVTFPALDFIGLNARKQEEEARNRAETARLEQVRREIDSGVQRARARLEAARKVAANTPVQLEAARAAEQQAGARYRAGLASLVEVADAQRLLSQAEIDDALARLNIWRGLLAVAYAHGDLDVFLKAVQ